MLNRKFYKEENGQFTDQYKKDNKFVCDVVEDVFSKLEDRYSRDEILSIITSNAVVTQVKGDILEGLTLEKK